MPVVTREMGTAASWSAVDPAEKNLVLRIANALVLCAVAVIWVSSWAGYLVAHLVFGIREDSPLEDLQGAQNLEPQVDQALGWVVVCILGLAIIFGLFELPSRKQWLPLLLILPWAALHFMREPEPSIMPYLFPAVVVAVAIARPSSRALYRLVAALGIVTAVLSLATVLMAGPLWGMPDLAFMPSAWAERADKAMIGDQILRGIYPHSNAMAISLVLPLPFVLLQLPRPVAIPAAVLMLWALIWSASRISLAVAAVLLVFALVLPLFKPRWGRLLGLGAVVIAGFAAVLTPFFPFERRDLSARGAIWQESIKFVQQGHLWFGGGPTTFPRNEELADAIGLTAVHAHNALLTVAVSGGMFALLLLFVVLVGGVGKATRDFTIDPMPLVFLAALLLVGVAEDPLTAFNGRNAAWFIYPLLAIVFAQYEKNQFSWGPWRHKYRHSHRLRLRREMV